MTTIPKMKRENDDTTDDAHSEGKRSKVEAGGGDKKEQDAASNSEAPQEPSSGSEKLAAATSPPQEMTASEFLGATADPAGGEASSSSKLAAGGNNGAEAQPSTAGEGGANSSKDIHRPQSLSASLMDADSAGESNKAPTHAGHTFDNMEDIDILEYSRDHTGSLSFPEKLMLMLLHIAKYYREMPDQAPTAWVDEGKAFVVHNTDRLCNDWIPLFFRPCKFSSFKRKLFRWEFRLGAVSSKDVIPAESQEIVFCNENFKRDQKNLLSRMQSVTAEKTAEKCDLDLAANMSADEQATGRPSPKGRSRSRPQKQQNRQVQEPQSGGGLLQYPYSSMLPPHPGIDLMHSLQQTLHGPAGAQFLQQQQQQPNQQGGGGMTTIPADPMARHVLAEAAAKATAAGHQPGQLLLSLPELQELMARGGQHSSQAAQHQYHSHHAALQLAGASSNSERDTSCSTTTAAAKDQLPIQDRGGGASADDNDGDRGESNNDTDGEKQQLQSRQTTTTMPPGMSELLARQQQQQRHQAGPLLSVSQDEQLQHLLAWQSRQLSQFSGGGGGLGASYPTPPLNGGGGGGGAELLNPHRTSQEEQIRQFLRGTAASGAAPHQGQQHNGAPFGNGGGGSHFGQPGNPW